jgi:hypothetical protein
LIFLNFFETVKSEGILLRALGSLLPALSVCLPVGPEDRIGVDSQSKGENHDLDKKSI